MIASCSFRGYAKDHTEKKDHVTKVALDGENLTYFDSSSRIFSFAVLD